MPALRGSWEKAAGTGEKKGESTTFIVKTTKK